jgi:RNA-directed DNA polymerase
VYFETVFSEYSYGFRANKSAHDAIHKAKQYIESGYEYVVDIDLAKYFDTVNHDKLMALLSMHIGDKRVLKLIRSFLNSGVMINGVVFETYSGCPQGGPLSRKRFSMD